MISYNLKKKKIVHIILLLNLFTLRYDNLVWASYVKLVVRSFVQTKSMFTIRS